MKGIPVLPNGDPVRRTIVIADNYQEFRYWCMFSRVNPNSRMVRFASTWDRLRGISDCDFVLAGLCRNQPDREMRRSMQVIRNCPGYAGETYHQYEPADIEPDIVHG